MEAYMQDDYSTAPVYNPSLAAFKEKELLFWSSAIPIFPYVHTQKAMKHYAVIAFLCISSFSSMDI